MAEVFSLLLAGGALLVFCLAMPTFRGTTFRGTTFRGTTFRGAAFRRPVPVRQRPARLGLVRESAVLRADGGHVLGRHDDRRCPR
jgi:hypothetical protein